MSGPPRRSAGACVPIVAHRRHDDDAVRGRDPSRRPDFPALPTGSTRGIVVDLAGWRRTSPACKRDGLRADRLRPTPRPQERRDLPDAAGRGRARLTVERSARPRSSWRGIDDVLSPIRSGPTVRSARLRALHEAAPGCVSGVDSVDGARGLAALCGSGAVAAAGVVESIRVSIGRRRHARAAVSQSPRRRSRRGGVFSHAVTATVRAQGARGEDEIRTLTAQPTRSSRAGSRSGRSAPSYATMLTQRQGRSRRSAPGPTSRDRQQAVLGAIPPQGCAVAVRNRRLSLRRTAVIDAGAKALTKDRATGSTAMARSPASRPRDHL